MITLEHGHDPWVENAFYFQVLDVSTRIAQADARVERWVDFFRKKREQQGEDRWTDQHPPRERPSPGSLSA